MKYTQEQIEKKLQSIIAEQLHIDPEVITTHATLVSLGADSLDVVELVMHVEDEFDLEVSDEEAEKLHTLGDVVAYVEKHQEK